MPYKLGKFHCSDCGKSVHTPKTKLCRKCYTISRTGIELIDKGQAKLYRKKYKQEYFQKNKEKIYARRKNTPISPDQREHYYIKSKYGISGIEYQQMLKDRNFLCDICGYEQPVEATGREKLFIDHCHFSKKVRGLLCFSCNTAIGHFKDNPQIISKALEYIKKWRED